MALDKNFAIRVTNAPNEISPFICTRRDECARRRRRNYSNNTGMIETSMSDESKRYGRDSER